MFLSTRKLGCLLCVVVIGSSIGSRFVFGQDDLRVLPTESELGPTRDMLSRYLAKQLDEAIESRRAAYEKINVDTPPWSDVLRVPLKGRMSGTVHGALTVYDLPDLLAAYRSFRKLESQP